jgi:CHAT domain-containing protein
MKFSKTSRTVLLTILTVTISTPLTPLLQSLLETPQVLAQDLKSRKSESDKADQLLKQGSGSSVLDQPQRIEAALQSLQQALKLYRNLKDIRGEGRALHALGIYYEDQIDSGRAIEYQQKALTIARTIKDLDLEAKVLFDLAKSYKNSDKAKAVEYALQSVDIADKGRNYELAIKGSSELTGYLPKGSQLEFFQRQLEISRQSKKRYKEAANLYALGLIYHADKNKEKSVDYYQQSFNVTQEINEHKPKNETSTNLINEIINYEKSKEYFQQRLVVARQQKNRYSEAALLNALGRAYSNKHSKDYRKALTYYQQSLDIALEIRDRELVANVLNHLSNAYSKLDAGEPATKYFQQKLAVVRQLKNRHIESVIVNILGDIYNKLFKDSRKALTYYQQSLDIALETREHDLVSANRNNLIRAYDSLKANNEAIEYLRQRLEISRQRKNRYEAAQILNILGEVYGDKLKDYDKASEYYQQGLNIAQEIREYELADDIRGDLRDIYEKSKAYDRAIVYFRQRLTIAQKRQDLELEKDMRYDLEKSYQGLRELAKPVEFHQQMLASARKRQDRHTEADVLGNIGAAYFSLKDYDNAFKFWQQQLAVIRSLKNSEAEMKLLFFIGSQYLALNDSSKGLEYYQQGVAIAQMPKASLKTVDTLFKLEQQLFAQGSYGVAIELAQQHLKFARKIENRYQELIALSLLESGYSNLGNYDKVAEYAHQSLAIARQVKNTSTEISPLSSLGTALLFKGEYKSAIEYLKQSLAIFEVSPGKGLAPELKSNFLSMLGTAYGSSGDYDKAIEYLQQSLATLQDSDKKLLSFSRTIRLPQEAFTLNILGAAYLAKGNSSQAIETLQKSIAIAQQIQDRRREGFALHYLGLNAFRAGNLVEAEKTLLSAIQAWESTRKLSGGELNKVSIFDVQAETYRLLQKVLIAQNKPEAALEIAERGRARAFVESLTKQLGNQSDTIKPPNLEEIKQIAKIQNATLVEYSIIYDDSKIEVKPPSQEVKLFIWVVQPKGNVTFRQVDLKVANQQPTATLPYQIASRQPWVAQQPQRSAPSLSDLVNQTRDAMDIGDRGQPPQPRTGIAANPLIAGQLRKLHQLLIEPITDLLPTDPNARVIFMPQKSLFFVPFPALPDASGKRLIEKHTILTAPSIQVLQLTRQQREKLRQSPADKSVVVGVPRNAVVVGNPEPMPGQLLALPGAEEEAKAIAALLNTQPILANQATKATVVAQLPQARIIHLATHGLLDDPQGTGIPGVIALAPSDKDNGFLTAGEILNLKLKAELAVLSACDTGKGKLTEDGVIGLSRSLITAGVPSVVVSLWKIPDAPTALLMTEFYQNLNRNPDKAQALRQAMLTTMTKYPNPSDWAAFTLMGEAE